jgi:hypothetical protein
MKEDYLRRILIRDDLDRRTSQEAQRIEELYQDRHPERVREIARRIRGVRPIPVLQMKRRD